MITFFIACVCGLWSVYGVEYFFPLEMFVSSSELRSRIASVKNSKKITDAMKLVASAKLRRAQEAVIQSRPFSEALQGVFGEVITRVEGTDVAEDPLLKEREIKTITLVIIGGDRGLCGGYNNQLIKRSSLRYDELVAQGVLQFSPQPMLGV